MNRVILFNPISVVHDRHIGIFRNLLKDWRIRCIYNTNFPWFHDKRKNINEEIFCFSGGRFQRAPKNIFDDVALLILFTSQPRIPPCSLIQEATLRNIPVIAIEEVFQMMLQQGALNNYLLPVDHFFVGSDYEKDRFVDSGISGEIIEVTGCMFRNRRGNTLSKDANLKNKFGLSDNKPVLTFCLDALSSEVDSLAANSKLINYVFDNMPSGYELLIKPHPENRIEDFTALMKNISTKIKITDPKIPIYKILDITDILINRGNSQVIIDALEGGIPVVLTPFGKKTFFHGILDGLIADNGNLCKAVNYARDRGMGLYSHIFRKYLSISPAQATENIINRIEQIAKKRETLKTQERLLELGLFWAWMGQIKEGKGTLLSLKKNSRLDKDILNKLYLLISCKTDRNDLAILKEWAKNGYRKWVIQSLWIKDLYLNKRRLNLEDKEWLRDFPPRMERQRFLNYAILLYWGYLNSEMVRDAQALIDELGADSLPVPVTKKLKSLILTSKKRPYFDMQYLISRLSYSGKLALKNFILK